MFGKLAGGGNVKIGEKNGELAFAVEEKEKLAHAEEVGYT